MSDTPESETELEEDSLEPFREVPVGTNDPNIVGDVDAFDKPPGSDPHEEGEFHDEEADEIRDDNCRRVFTN